MMIRIKKLGKNPKLNRARASHINGTRSRRPMDIKDRLDRFGHLKTPISQK